MSVNATRIILLITPIGCQLGLFLSGAVFQEHRQSDLELRRDLIDHAVIALIHFAILAALLAKANRDKTGDRIAATIAVLLSWLPFAGPIFSGLLSLWLAWDLRKSVSKETHA